MIHSCQPLLNITKSLYLNLEFLNDELINLKLITFLTFRTTRIHPPGGLSHITYDVMPQTNDAKSSSR